MTASTTLDAAQVARRPAVVLVSGGLDSATCLAIARAEGFACHALSFSYGQRHAAEVAAAARVAQALGAVEHRVMTIDLAIFGGSALTDPGIAVPEAPTAGIPVTYVPARNTVFLSLALAWSEVLGAHDIYIGVNAVDYSGYPDCRPEFVAAFEQMANLATRMGTEGRGVRIRAPLMDLNKAGIIRLGQSLGVDFANTHSCYDPIEGRACGRCPSCRLRLKGFQQVGIADPIEYAKIG